MFLFRNLNSDIENDYNDMIFLSITIRRGILR